MSARLVSYADINVLVSFARTQRLALPSPWAPSCVIVTAATIEHAYEFGRELVRENLRPSAYCYGDNPPPDRRFRCAASYLDDFCFSPDPRGLMTASGAGVAIIKATHFYDYQCAGTPDYGRSCAAGVTRNIRVSIGAQYGGQNCAPITPSEGSKLHAGSQAASARAFICPDTRMHPGALNISLAIDRDGKGRPRDPFLRSDRRNARQSPGRFPMTLQQRDDRDRML